MQGIRLRRDTGSIGSRQCYLDCLNILRQPGRMLPPTLDMSVLKEARILQIRRPDM